MGKFCSLGPHCWLLIALLVCASSSRECTERDSLLREMSSAVDMPSECILRCTAHTYSEMLKRRLVQTVRFNPTSPSELGQHCWPTQMKCGVGERLERAFIVLPLQDKTQGAEDSLRLRPTFPTKQETLQPLNRQAVLSSDCGLRFDVTGPFVASESQTMFCVEVVRLPGVPAAALKCPPFLVTTWLKQHLPAT
ncbi:hypothetical protein GJAV_G00023600 [Gymnothorax javanicus]|nr:hypothetical protein GJAV_G00023600 [Gymnothorax javanicus]